MKIKKNFIPSIIVLITMVLNLPILILFNFLNPKLIELFFIIAPIQCILFGCSTIYIELYDRKNKRKTFKVCYGIIKKSKFKLINSSWIKSLVVSYIVDGQEYKTTTNFGINGLLSLFIKGKKIKVYYKEDNPQITSFDQNIFLLSGIFSILVGIFCIYYVITTLY